MDVSAMKIAAWIIVYILLACTFIAIPVHARDELASVVIAGPKPFMVAHHTALEDICLGLWDLPDTPENREWVRDGWVEYRHVPSGTTVLVYQVFVNQIRATVDASEIQWVKSKLDNNPNCRAERTWNFNNFLSTNSLEWIIR